MVSSNGQLGVHRNWLIGWEREWGSESEGGRESFGWLIEFRFVILALSADTQEAIKDHWGTAAQDYVFSCVLSLSPFFLSPYLYFWVGFKNIAEGGYGFLPGSISFRWIPSGAGPFHSLLQAWGLISWFSWWSFLHPEYGQGSLSLMFFGYYFKLWSCFTFQVLLSLIWVLCLMRVWVWGLSRVDEVLLFSACTFNTCSTCHWGLFPATLTSSGVSSFTCSFLCKSLIEIHNLF